MRKARVPALVGVCLCLASCGEPSGPPLRITVPDGAIFQQVVDTLVDREIVGTGGLFAIYGRIKGADRQVRAGGYAFRVGESWSTIIEELTAGRVLTDPMTIPEGFTLRRMAPRLAAITGQDEGAVLEHLNRDSLDAVHGVPGPGLEGYLFPDTYLIAPGAALDAVIDAMVQRYLAFWTAERRSRLDDLPLTEREVVTLASIIQAEARHVTEMPAISSVYHNRLRIGYLLQADPTVLYALGGFRERLLYAAIDSVADHPYNTYTQAGLPPGPIGAPGEAALDAALVPADTDFLYFVARPNGEHVFTRSLTEHNRAKAAARREWDTARASGGTRPPDDTTAAGGSGRP
jgi:UPF0755 protein